MCVACSSITVICLILALFSLQLLLELSSIDCVCVCPVLPQAKYHEDFERERGRGYTPVMEDVGMDRLQRSNHMMMEAGYKGVHPQGVEMDRRPGIIVGKEQPGFELRGGLGGLTPLIKTWTPPKEVKTTGRGGRYIYISFLPVIVNITLRPGEKVDPPDCHCTIRTLGATVKVHEVIIGSLQSEVQ